MNLPIMTAPSCLVTIAAVMPSSADVLPSSILACARLGPRTVTHMLWSVRSVTAGHISSYHCFFSRGRWSLRPLGQALAARLVALIGAAMSASADN